ncbi:hypothetical protein SAMN02990966_03450 [Rhodospirillales bacterium URHD0017]|nr:hypothetical protein SAMN02990966_03450 [Rhodospirillales bacterium URHD0017]
MSKFHSRQLIRQGRRRLLIAYIGPGLAVGSIATILGLFAGVALMATALVLYPLKRLWLRLRGRSK